MKMSLKFALALIFCGLVLIPTPSIAQENPDKTSKDSEKESRVVFPLIEGWEKGEIVTYPKPELGYSLPYKSSEGGTVTIYIYNGGNKEISSDLNNQTIKNEMERSKNEIQKVGELGYYDDVKLIKDDTVKLGGESGKVESLRSLFNFSIRGTDVTSEIYLFSYHNNFIKIRATRMRDKEEEENEAFAALLVSVDTLFSK